MNKKTVEIFVARDERQLARFLLSIWRSNAQDSAARNAGFSAALSGGTTPEFFYRSLSDVRDNEIWENTHVFLADERLVPYSNTASNFGMMKALFLDRVGIRSSHLHEVAAGLLPPARAAAAYEVEMRQFFCLSGKQDLPVFDMILLGIGEDGHTASLFPGESGISSNKRLAVYVKRDTESFGRVSLTLKVINNARNAIFLATGTRKADILRRVIVDNDGTLPAAMVAPHHGRLIFALDREAASLIPHQASGNDKYRFINEYIRED